MNTVVRERRVRNRKPAKGTLESKRIHPKICIMFERRRNKEPDRRLDWRDPDMPVLRAMTTGMEEMTPEDESAYSDDVMQRSVEPTWREDPTYNLGRGQRRSRR